jgi:chitodextrinase
MKLRGRLKTDGVTHTLIAPQSNLETGVWTHVALVYDGLTLDLYQNGVRVGSISKSGLLSTDASVPTSIGSNPQIYGVLDGTVDDLRIYNRALTSNEVLTDMNTPVGGTTPTPKFSLNDRVQTTDTVNVRASASTQGTLLGTQPTGALGTVIGGPVSADGYTWWNVNFDSGADGWTVETYLLKTTTNPTPTDTTPPTLSGITAGSVTTSGATVSWTTNEPSDTQVDYGTTLSYGNSTTLNSSLVTSHSQTLSSLSPDTLYHYRVRSRDAAGNLAVSSDYTFTTLALPDTTAPSAPASLTATALSTTEINLTWTASTDTVGVTGYRIERCPGSTCTNFGEIGTTASTGYTDRSLSAGTTYRYRVRATDAAGNLSAYSSIVSVATLANPAPDTTAPVISGISYSGGNDSRTITWTTNEPADSLLRWGTSASSLTQSTSDSTLVFSHTLTMSGLNRRTKYYFQVVSKDAAGNSASSPVMTFDTKGGKPPKVTDLQATTGSVVLSWAKVGDPDARSIVITRTENGTVAPHTEEDAVIATLPTSAATYRDTAARYGTTYTYAIYVVDRSGEASDPTILTFTPKERTTPVSPGVLRPTPSAYLFTDPLFPGSRGIGVQKLQELLLAKGYLTPDAVTGYYGPLTAEAVKRYQCAQGVVCSGTPETTGYGLVGAQTRLRLNAERMPEASNQQTTLTQIQLLLEQIQALKAQLDATR